MHGTPDSHHYFPMTPPESNILQVLFVFAFALCTSYAAGRVHQWYKHALDRDEAWRGGYDRATHSLFNLATRAGREAQAAPTASVVKLEANVPAQLKPAAPRHAMRGVASVGAGRPREATALTAHPMTDSSANRQLPTLRGVSEAS